MKGKRMIGILLLAGLLLSMTACGSVNEKPPASGETETTGQTQGIDATEQTQGTETQPEQTENKLLTLEKTLHTRLEWVDGLDRALVKSENAPVTMGQADSEAFPAMAQRLEQLAAMQTKSMEEEFDNFVVLAREARDLQGDSFEPWESILDTQVCRADSVVISLLSDSYSHYGQIRDLRVLRGTTFDTQTGEPLLLQDVVKVNNDLAEAVEKELTGHTWTGELYTPSAVEDFFANAPYDIDNWTLSYMGITFYFAPGELCDEGALTATVSFGQYPELFSEKYTAVPAEYMVEVPLNSTFYDDVNGDGSLEALLVAGEREEERGQYAAYSVHTEAGDFREEVFCYNYHPYFARTETGCYLYLFCQDFQEGQRQMDLVVLKLHPDGSVTKVGQESISPAWLADNRFVLPADPNALALETGLFEIGNDGMPEEK